MATDTPPGSAAQQLVCGAILIMPVMYTLVGTGLRTVGTLPPEGLVELEGDLAQLLTVVFLVVSIAAGLLSPMVKRMLLRVPAREGAEQEIRFKAVLVAMAVSEFGAVLGLVLMLLTGNTLLGALLCALSFTITCFHFPRRSWLEFGSAPR